MHGASTSKETGGTLSISERNGAGTGSSPLTSSSCGTSYSISSPSFKKELLALSFYRRIAYNFAGSSSIRIWISHDTSTRGGSAHTPSCVSTQAETKAEPFVETFQDNQRGWEQGNSDGLASTVRGNTYTISVAKDLAYFLCPSSTSSGMLPDNFSLTSQIAQKQGRSDVFYGLAYRLGYEKDVSKVYSYAFVINGRGDWAIIKYDPHVSNGNSVMKYGKNFSAIHDVPATNELEVIVQGSKFSFKINGIVLPINELGQADQSLIDQSYTGGHLALLVSGPNTNFVVTSIKLTVP